jgi:hypothetical protein
VAPHRVVECFNIVEDGKLSVPASDRHRFLDAGLGLERAPERFHGRIIVAISRPAHASLKASLGDGAKVAFVDILAASIGVMKQARRRPAPLQGLMQGSQDQGDVKRRGACPADHPPTPQIHDRSQVYPAFLGSEIGDIGDPDLVGTSRGGLLCQEVFRHGLAVVAVRRARPTRMLFTAP